MKVIDKRKKSKDEDWNVGDVVCYYNQPDEKYYGLICEIKLPTDSGVGVIDLENKTKSLVSFAFPSIDDLQHLVLSEYRHVEKVNAHLVVED